MTNLSIDNSINQIFTDISFSQNNLFQSNLNIMETLSLLTTINNYVIDLSYINILLNTLGKNILSRKYLIEGSNNITHIINNITEISLNTIKPYDSDNLFLKLRYKLIEEDIHFKLIDNDKNTDNYIILLVDPSLSIVTFSSVSQSSDFSNLNLKNLDNFNLDNVLNNNVNYYEIESTSTHYKIILVNRKVLNL